jgi:hypothetical protein
MTSESVSAEVKAVEEFLQILDKLIMEENCFPEQIFSVMKPVCTMIKITY